MDDLHIRRPELRDVQRAGTVRWWKSDKGYGRVTADDGEVLFVHASALRNRHEIQQDDRVSFVWGGGVADHGRHSADEVTVLGNPSDDVELDTHILETSGIEEIEIELDPATPPDQRDEIVQEALRQFKQRRNPD